jgi:hypothetical protein
MGRIVTRKYKIQQIISIVKIRYSRDEFTGIRKATRPAKNKKREVWRSMGMVSTNAAILYFLMPWYRYVLSRARS